MSDRVKSHIAYTAVLRTVHAYSDLIVKTGVQDALDDNNAAADFYAALDEEDYDDAAEKFSAAFQLYGKALDDYREAEDQATGDYKQTLIQRACRVEGLRNAAEAAFAGAKLYDDGAFEQGNEKFATAREQLNRDC